MRTSRSATTIGLIIGTLTGHAHEGMWLPTLLQAIEGDMRTEGLLIGAEDIYGINHGSLKDAVAIFGGGCTAEVISEQGLILTNHHCGYSAIQQHSSLEHDYLKDGFFAPTLADELRNEGLTVTFIVRMDDVTDRVLATLKPGMSEAERKDAVAKVGEEIGVEAMNGTGYKAVVRPFNYGNSYYLIVSETFRDVRLVCAPPGAIGRFGGDTDNWMWPRHNADFSIFRIYADKDNKPADFALTNVPYKPAHSLPIDLDGVKEGDFDMIFGFPGSTQRYLSSYAVDYVLNTGDPLRIRMREAALNVIDAAMLASDRTRIQYAGKQSGISNAYKKWIGEVRGLNELKTLQGKRDFEAEYVKRASGAGRSEYVTVTGDLANIYADYPRYAKARDLFSELVGSGCDMLRYCDAFKGIVTGYDELAKSGKLDAEVKRLQAAMDGNFRNYDARVDREVLKAQLPIYQENVDPALAAPDLAVIFHDKAVPPDGYLDKLFDRSVFTDSLRLRAALKNYNAKSAKRLAKDPAFMLSQAIYASYNERVKPKVTEYTDRIEADMRTFVRGQMELFPEKTYWPDANGTLRLSYGHVEGSEPRDGVRYEPFTTLRGVMEKYKPGDAEFDVPRKLIDIYNNRDYAPYSTNGEMPVCFTSSLHTTGGNSGSPVLNGRGELIGLNFDRTWESTMSDIQFDPARCRNIAVDVRYLLLVIDKVCGAHRLVDEMRLMHHADAPRSIQPLKNP